MTLKDFVNHLINIVNMPTYYSNKYPNNLGFVHSDGRRSFDCWNLIKAVLNGYDENNKTEGYYQKDLSKTGDVTIDGLLKNSHDRSSNFNMIKPGAIMKYTGGTHAGTFVGEHEIAGKLYNVIECTASWDKRVLWSWVDADGTRRHYKGCTAKNGMWVEYGYHNLLQADTGDVGGIQAVAGKPQATQENTDKTYTVVKGDTLWGISAKFLGSGLKWRHISDYNNLKSTVIHPGQILKIPVE